MNEIYQLITPALEPEVGSTPPRIHRPPASELTEIIRRSNEEVDSVRENIKRTYHIDFPDFESTEGRQIAEQVVIIFVTEGKNLLTFLRNLIF